MNDITPKEAREILSHYTNLGYGIVIEDEDTSKIVQALDLACKTLASGGDLISREALKTKMKEADAEAIDYEMLVAMYEKLVNDAPAVDPEKPQGEWVDREYRRYLPRDAEPGYNDDTYDEKTHSVMSTHIVCSNCGAERRFYHNFCGNCGAEMRKGDTE